MIDYSVFDIDEPAEPDDDELSVGDTEPHSGSHWLSDERMIASLSQSQLLMFAERYARMAKLCARELTLRQAGLAYAPQSKPRRGANNATTVRRAKQVSKRAARAAPSLEQVVSELRKRAASNPELQDWIQAQLSKLA